MTRPKQGTPQGGVISPLLANLYLHWFEKLFYRSDGPGRWANAKLVRYADDFVVLARYQSQQLIQLDRELLEGRFRLTVNREKTRIVKLHEPGQSLNFLGFTLRYDRDLFGRDHRYLNVFPSTKAMTRAHDRVRELTGPKRCFVPIRRDDRRHQPLEQRLERVLPPRLSPAMLSGPESFHVAPLDASLATSESTSLPYPGRRVILLPSAAPRPAALVNDSRLTPCACLGPRGFGQAGCGKSASPV